MVLASGSNMPEPGAAFGDTLAVEMIAGPNSSVHCLRSTSGLIHYVALRDLKPSTQYYYTIGDPADATSLCVTSTESQLLSFSATCAHWHVTRLNRSGVMMTLMNKIEETVLPCSLRLSMVLTANLSCSLQSAC